MAPVDHSAIQSADSSSLQTPEKSSYVRPIESLLASKMNLEVQSQLTRHISIDTLPNELLLNIFGYLDGPQPSTSHLAVYDEPGFDLTQSSITNLKSISCVSKRWREAVLPTLFRHSQLIITETKTNGGKVPSEIKLFFHFITQNRLHKVITSFTLICYNQSFKVIYNRDPSHVLSTFWRSLFSVIDPIDLLIIAPSQALSFLTACPVNVEDSWCFDCPCQYLRLQRLPTHQVDKSMPDIDRDSDQNTKSMSTPSIIPNVYEELPNPSEFHEEDPEENGENVFADASVLFGRPWSKLLLNEGSFIRAYTTYEFWKRQPPSILSHLLGTPTSSPLFSPSIRDMEYISIFPMDSHFSNITQKFPRLDRLYVQFVPRSEILHDASKMTQVESENLWMERNRCYALLMRELFNVPPVGNYRWLQTFESGDAEDKDGWNMAEYMKNAGNGWKVTEGGVFVRDEIDFPPSP